MVLPALQPLTAWSGPCLCPVSTWGKWLHPGHVSSPAKRDPDRPTGHGGPCRWTKAEHTAPPGNGTLHTAAAVSKILECGPTLSAYLWGRNVGRQCGEKRENEMFSPLACQCLLPEQKGQGGSTGPLLPPSTQPPGPVLAAHVLLGGTWNHLGSYSSENWMPGPNPQRFCLPGPGCGRALGFLSTTWRATL